jgi:hypothetical protein
METPELETVVTDAASNAPTTKTAVIVVAASLIAAGAVFAVVKWRKSRSEETVEATPETV